MHTVPGETRWLSAAKRLAARLVVARFLDVLGTPLVLGAALAAIAGLLGRMTVLSFPLSVGLGAAALVASIAWAGCVAGRARRGLRREALLRLDASLGLHDRLAAAAEGAVPWPEFPARLPELFRWRWSRVCTAPAIALAILAAALWLPVGRVTPTVPPPAERPPVFGELADLVEELKQSEAAAPAALDQLQQTLEELLARDSAGLYSHGTLEAAANLVDQTAAGAGELAAGLAAAEAALNQLADAADPAAQQAARDALGSALRALENARLPVNPALAGGLRHAAAGGVDPQQLANLSRNLRNAAGRAGAAGSGSTTMNFATRAGSPSRGSDGRWRPPSWNKGEPGGNGGVDRGPGHPPLALASDPADRRDGTDAALESRDTDQAGLGDLISESAGAPRTDPLRGPETGAAGTIADPGRGADAARVDELTPAERRAVRRFFK